MSQKHVRAYTKFNYSRYVKAGFTQNKNFVPNIFFFGKCFKTKLLNIVKNLFFYLKVQSFRLIMQSNFLQMATSADHAVAYTIGPIFKHIFDCVQLDFTNGFTNIVQYCKASIVYGLSA